MREDQRRVEEDDPRRESGKQRDSGEHTLRMSPLGSTAHRAALGSTAHRAGAGYNHGAASRILRNNSISVRSFITWLHGIALIMGGPGLFAVAFLDSSFISLPQINDILVVLMVIEHKERMLYYAAMATAGSVAGCYAIYYLAEKGGETFLRKRLHAGHIERALNLYRRHGVLALMVPALLPPPAPFKLFVLAAGLAEVRRWQFIWAIAAARGARYLALGILAVYYGDQALELMRTHGRVIALWLAALIVVAAVLWWLRGKRLARARATGTP